MNGVRALPPHDPSNRRRGSSCRSARSAPTAADSLALGGIAYFFHEVLGFFTGLHRKCEDEAEVIEHRELHRAA